MFEFDIFREEVLADYTNKRNEGTLPTSLENPSPANLRNYALYLYCKGLNKEDRIVFEEYFNSNVKVDDLEKAINTTELGKLKSVQNFLNGTTRNPDEIIAKLLAVLIDFKPRPFRIFISKSFENNFLREELETIEEEKNEREVSQSFDS